MTESIFQGTITICGTVSLPSTGNAAQVATWRGRRLKLRYRGVTKNHAWLKRRTAAINLRTLLGKGLARRDGAWILAT